MKWYTHDVFSIILLYNFYIFTAAQSKAQYYFIKIRAKQNNIHNKEHISIIKKAIPIAKLALI